MTVDAPSGKPDVLIIGGGLCGVGAAFTLVGQGKKVMIVERRASLAWEVTAAFQCGWGESDSPLAQRFRSGLDAHAGRRGDRISPPVLEMLLNRLLAEAGIDLLLYSYPLKLVTSGDLVTGVVIGNKTGQEVVAANVVVDATDEAALWRQTDVAFDTPAARSMRQTVFFNRVGAGLELPHKLGDSVGARNITIHSSVREGEICAEFDVPGYSISKARLALAEAIFALRVNTVLKTGKGAEVSRLLTWPMVTHSGIEPFPLEVAAHLRENRIVHPALRNLLAAGLWTLADEADRKKRNTVDGRIRLGEETGRIAAALSIRAPEPAGVKLPFIPSVCREADVVVCGGGTAGPAAAIAAGRRGARTILLEAGTLLGGMGTGGVVHSYYPMVPAGLLGAGGLTAPRKLDSPEKVFGYYCRAFGGLQNELDARVGKTANFLFDGKFKCFGFHPEAKKLVLEQMCHEAGVEVVYGATVIGVEMDKKRKNVIRGVVVATSDGPVVCRGKVVIDSTGDADVAAKAGAQFTMGREGDGVQHTFTQLGGFLGDDGSLGLGGNPTDLGYVDPSDAADLTRARRLGLEGLFDRPRPNLLHIGPLLGLRECRQVIGEYRLTLADQVAGRRFEDCIGYMQAHHDNHADDYENESDEEVLWVWILGRWQEVVGCEVPYRCLVPKRIEGLLVACRSASMTVGAHYAFRMMPEMQQIGEAAGIAAALSAKRGVMPRALDVRLIQNDLRKRGVLAEKNSPSALIPARPLSELKDAILSDNPRDAVWLLSQCEKRKAVPLLKEALRLAEGRSRFWVSVALAMHRCPEAAPELMACVKERRGDVPDGLKTVPIWESAMVLLGRIGDARAVPVLLDVIADESAGFDALIAAARALGRIGDSSAVGGLRGLLERGGLGERKKLRRPAREDVLWQIELAIAEALAGCGGPCGDVTERYSKDPRAYVRRYAARIADKSGKAGREPKHK